VRVRGRDGLRKGGKKREIEGGREREGGKGGMIGRGEERKRGRKGGREI
jgi:hypothetical protein